jgi:hypothetical protein
MGTGFAGEGGFCADIGSADGFGHPFFRGGMYSAGDS